MEREGQRALTGRIVPIYPLTAGVTQTLLIKAIQQGLEACRELVDRLTAEAVEALACFGAEGEGLAWLAGTLAAREK